MNNILDLLQAETTRANREHAEAFEEARTIVERMAYALAAYRDHADEPNAVEPPPADEVDAQLAAFRGDA